MLRKYDITHRKRTNQIEILLNEMFAAEECSLATKHITTIGIILPKELSEIHPSHIQYIQYIQLQNKVHEWGVYNLCITYRTGSAQE